MKIKNILILFSIISLSFGAGYWSSNKVAVVNAESSKLNDVKTTEKIVIKEKGGKTTTIERKIKDNSIQVDNPPRKWRMSVLIDPISRDNAQVGLGYRVYDSVFLEGSIGNNNGGQLMLGIGVEF